MFASSAIGFCKTSHFTLTTGGDTLPNRKYGLKTEFLGQTHISLFGTSARYLQSSCAFAAADQVASALES